LISCVNIINKIKSVYWWGNKIYKKNEDLLICKSVKNNFKKIVKQVRIIHPYEVPEIVCYEILDGEKNYLNWISQYTKNATKK
jgi:periplasmic divalent cation tolerance protein